MTQNQPAPSARSKGRFASLPPEGYSRPGISPDGKSLTIWDEDGTKSVTVSLKNAGPERLVIEWVKCLARVTGPSGTWRSLQTAVSSISRSRMFVMWAAGRVETLDDLDAEDWLDFVHHVRENSPDVTPTTRNGRITTVKTVLLAHEGLSYALGQQLARRYMETQETPSQSNHYSAAEFQRIRAAAKRALSNAWKRIEPNWELARTPEADVPEDLYPRWQALHSLLRDPKARLRAAEARALKATDKYGNPLMRDARDSLYLDTHEGLAAYAAIIATNGENLSTTSRRDVPSTAASIGSEHTILTSERVKKRRGPRASHMPENIAIESPLGQVLELVMKCTEPARVAVKTNPQCLVDSHPKAHNDMRHASSDSLILFTRSDGTMTNVISHIPKPFWLPHGTSLTFQRLHRTYLTRIAQHNVDNAYRTWVEAYILKDPERLKELEDIHRKAHQRALDKIKDLSIRLYTEDQARSQGLDITPTTKGTRCQDITTNPDTGTYCSRPWLSCLGCSNAYIVLSNLPPLVALFDLLEGKRRNDDDRERWRREYLEPWTQLTAILAEIDSSAVEQARAQVTPELTTQVWETVFMNRGEV